MIEEKQTEENIEEKEPWYKGPIKYIIMVFLLLLIVLWYFPTESIKLDPEPSRIPAIEEVLPQNFQLDNQTITIKNKNDFYSYIKPNDPFIKQIASKIAAISCNGNKICQAKAVYYFVRDNIEYVADPVLFEYVEDPKETLSTGSADCDGHAVLLATLEESIGINSELVFIPNHVLVSIYLPES